MARYGIRPARAFGVSMGTMQPLARRIGKDHDLARSLWESGWHEARLLAVLVDDPTRVTQRQMNAWAGDFDSWALCDTTCIRLFRKTPFAWDKARSWPYSPREFVRRAGFALMASLAVHEKAAPNARFLALLPIAEAAAGDGRNITKKGVVWALRAIGGRNSALNAATLTVARRLTTSDEATRRWVGQQTIRLLLRSTRTPRTR